MSYWNTVFALLLIHVLLVSPLTIPRWIFNVAQTPMNDTALNFNEQDVGNKDSTLMEGVKEIINIYPICKSGTRRNYFNMCKQIEQND